MHERFALGGTTPMHFGWLVRSEELVAVKRMHPLEGAGELSVRFDHPNVVSTLGVVRHPGELLAAMEYVPGASLAEIAEASPGGLEPSVATAIAAGTLHGLHAAHEARHSMVTREMTRASVLVGEDGSARVLDLDVRGPTNATAVVERLPYASPEQIIRRDLHRAFDTRRDVYAASVVLWETLTGRALFRATNIDAMLRKILWDAVPAPSSFAPWVDPELDAIVLRGLDRDPEKRFASAHAMALELERATCASNDDVARALAHMDLGCIRERRTLADAVRSRERSLLHIECRGGGSKG